MNKQLQLWSVLEYIDRSLAMLSNVIALINYSFLTFLMFIYILSKILKHLI